MAQELKTNVMRILDQAKIPYTAHTYTDDGNLGAVGVANILGQDPQRVFKTLVTRGKSNAFYVFVVPSFAELNLKKAAAAAGEKSVEMIKSKELLPTTGYIHGGCSPIGMKKKFKTFIHSSAAEFPTICVSAGKVGHQVELDPLKLMEAANIKPTELI